MLVHHLLSIGCSPVPIPQQNPLRPRYNGLSSGVVTTDRIVRHPRYVPAPWFVLSGYLQKSWFVPGICELNILTPIPASARPTIKEFIEGEAPQTAEPNSNKTSEPT